MSATKYAVPIRAVDFKVWTTDAFGNSVYVSLVDEIKKLQARVFELEHPKTKKKWWQRG